jgi:hypothetical protein
MFKKSVCLISFILVMIFTVHSSFGELVAYYPMDEGSGTLIRDFSGNVHHGQAQADPVWLDGQTGYCKAIYFDGSEPQPAWINCGTWNPSEQTGELTVACWIKWGGLNDNWQGIVGKRDGWDPDPDGPMMWYFEINGANGYLLFGRRDHYDVGIMDVTIQDQWQHLAATCDRVTGSIYVDGELVTSDDFTLGPKEDSALVIGADNLDGANGFFGVIDEVRLYDTALTQEEIQEIMFEVGAKPEPALAPHPENKEIEVKRDVVLTWKPGIYALKHNVYFGTDFNDVNEATTSDTRGVLVSENQDETTFDPLGNDLLEYDRTYYWRIDEINDTEPNSPWKGNVWTFTTRNFLPVDDFESYNDIDNIIYETWLDYYVNNTGMTAGYIESPSVEQNITHLGRQSMPLHYDNDGTVNNGTILETTGTLFYSETERQWASAQDWTREGVESLSLWFRGYPAKVSSFIEEPAGIFTVKGIGEDIWDNSDEFYFAYKQLSGSVKIIAKVDSLENTEPFAKAGIMLRDTLDANAKYCALLMTPENGVRYQYRSNADDITEREFDPNVAAPYWLRLERTGGGLIRAYYSENGSDWSGFALRSLIMADPIYVGLAVTSHNAVVPCQAQFSNVSFPNTTVAPEWTAQDIGLSTNEVEPMYIALNGNAIVFNEDPNAVLTDQWTEWKIPLQNFADRGVNLTNINSLSIGIGIRDSSQPGGEGTVYIDDIRLYRPPTQSGN